MNVTVREQRKRERRRIVIALAIALLVHFVVLLVALVVLIIAAIVNPPPEPAPEPEPVELTLIAPPEPKDERGFIDSAQTQVTGEAPENPDFESDENSIAASDGAATSDEKVPTLDGEREDGLAFRNMELTLGPSRSPAPPAPQPRVPQPPIEQQPPEPREEEQPTPTPQATPPPQDDLAVPEPLQPREQPTPEPEVRKPEPPTPPAVPRTPGFQPQTRTTRLTGGITNRGKASVDAVATPLGRYRKMLNDAIGSRWYYYVSDMMGMVNVGSVHITFIIRADGEVEKVRVTRNTSNESLASCSVRSIIEAEIPPIPREIAETLEGGKLEVDFSFTILGR